MQGQLRLDRKQNKLRDMMALENARTVTQLVTALAKFIYLDSGERADEAQSIEAMADWSFEDLQNAAQSISGSVQEVKAEAIPPGSMTP